MLARLSVRNEACGEALFFLLQYHMGEPNNATPLLIKYIIIWAHDMGESNSNIRKGYQQKSKKHQDFPTTTQAARLIHFSRTPVEKPPTLSPRFHHISHSELNAGDIRISVSASALLPERRRLGADRRVTALAVLGEHVGAGVEGDVDVDEVDFEFAVVLFVGDGGSVGLQNTRLAVFNIHTDTVCIFDLRAGSRRGRSLPR